MNFSAEFLLPQFPHRLLKDRHIRIILLRHGMDKGLVRQQFIDGDLTVEGQKQIRDLKELWNEIPISRIYCSPTKRSVQSSNILAEDHKIPVLPEKRLRPRDMGIVEGLSYREVQDRFANLLQNSTFTMDFRFPDGETNGDVFQRSGLFLRDLLQQLQGVKETFVIVSSPLVLNYMIFHLQNLGFREGLLYVFECGQFAFFESQDKYYQLKEFRTP